MTQLGPVKLGHIVAIIFGFFFINQILMGQIFSYALTNDTRTTAAAEAFYLVFPFLFFLVRYITEHRKMDVIYTLFVLGLIFFLLHRSVISTAGVAGVLVVGLAIIGKVEGSRLKIKSTAAMLFVLGILTLPLLGTLSPKRTEAFLDTIGGIFSPSEDETGSWRLEQSTYYMTNFLERPLLGWRYDGYDKGEIMENEDFPEKGTIIHSQYVDMLYNYGVAGMGLNLLIIFCTMYYIYVRNPKLSLEQTVMFSFIASGLLYGISYQLSPYYWSFVGLGMYYGGYKAPKEETDDQTTRQEATPTVIQPTYYDTHSHSRS
ncbi:O-antigen ligase family protein [Spirosoma sp. KUDC1026]|uniref:O-antigen ligase family protein n=1 Tax=Spirosoma sp. KUDC1026 TaxID=2745947 RepID=UPI00159BABB7|nr:O-antigen ligase family protein [Spirosoma sp. KUDC1026]QKZ11386.1 O-antigen ligase family protein [Spirosoma sp. KUDC1026]